MSESVVVAFLQIFKSPMNGTNVFAAWNTQFTDQKRVDIAAMDLLAVERSLRMYSSEGGCKGFVVRAGAMNLCPSSTQLSHTHVFADTAVMQCK